MVQWGRYLLVFATMSLVVISACRQPQKTHSDRELTFDRSTLSYPDLEMSESSETHPALSEIDTVSHEFTVDQYLADINAGVQPPVQSPRPADQAAQADDLSPVYGSPALPIIPGDSLSPALEIVWDFDQVLDTAASQHPILRARRYEVEMARAKLVSAGTLENPQFVFDTYTPVNNSDATSLRGRLTFDIPTAGKRDIQKRVANAEISRAQANLSRETDAVLLEAADAAIETLYLQEMMGLKAELARIALERSQLIELRLGRNNSPVGLADNVKVECDLAAINADLTDAEIQLTASRLRLSQAVGMRTPTLLAVSASPKYDKGPLISLQQFLAMGEQRQPQISEAEAVLQRSRHEHALEHANRIPDITFGPRYRHLIGENGDEIGARFSVDLPLLDQNEGAILDTAAQIQARQAEFEATEITVLTELAKAYSEVTALHRHEGGPRSEIDGKLAEYERLLRSPDIQTVLSREESLELRTTIVETRMRQVESHYRYIRLRTQLELLLDASLSAL
jgi:outer membrane protein, heavy metal efflux system